MKRVLIITYYWPPSGGSGVQRWLKFAKYLPQFGWQPVIYTPENPAFDVRDASLLEDVPAEAEVLKTKIFEPYHLLGKPKKEKTNKTNFGVLPGSERAGLFHNLMLWIRGNIMVPDPRVFWVQPSMRYLLRYLRSHPVDMVVTTGPPHSMHLIGLGLKRATDLPWIADFRDPWSKLDLLDDYRIMSSVRHRYEKMEQEVLKHCDLCLTVSGQWGKMFEALGARRVEVISNGFDRSDVPPETFTSSSRFIMSHFGLINHLRNPLPLWDALENLLSRHPQFRSDFLLKLGGNTDAVVLGAINQRPHLSACVVHEGYLQHTSLKEVYAQSSVLVLLCFNSEMGKGNIPGKLFEYLAANRPVLAFGHRGGDVDLILTKTSGGRLYSYQEDTVVLEEAILKWYKDYENRKNSGGNTEIIKLYDRRVLAERLAGVMNNFLMK